MSRVEKHPYDEGKFQSTFDDYGHGKGNGKSRNAIYKHFKKVNAETTQPEVVESPPIEIPIEESEEKEEPQWGRIEWEDDEDGEEPIPRTIPKPVSEMNRKKLGAMALQTQGQVVRYGFKVVDRLITHWGRGVMSKPDWELKRPEADYDTLEESTMMMLDHYGLMIPVNPLMVWGMTVSSAYAPPVSHVLKNRDPNKKRKGILSRIFRRKKKKVTEVDYDEADLKP
tara:strand:+ start:10753 stop:11430 length:678 start_codon:yes stop_codon:yes gene_type:complete